MGKMERCTNGGYKICVFCGRGTIAYILRPQHCPLFHPSAMHLKNHVWILSNIWYIFLGNVDEAILLFQNALLLLKDSKNVTADDGIIEKIMIDLAELLHSVGRYLLFLGDLLVFKPFLSTKMKSYLQKFTRQVDHMFLLICVLFCVEDMKGEHCWKNVC